MLFCAAGFSLWLAQSPVPQSQLSETSPILKDRNGAFLNVRTVEKGTWRLPADVEAIDPAFIEALLLIEDKRFYGHSGVDAAAIARALKSWKEQGKVVSGASTLTMQLVRQYRPRPRTLPSKIIESAEALRFELHFSPEARRPDRHAQAARLGRNRILRRLHGGGLIDDKALLNALNAPIPLKKKGLPNKAWLTAQKLGGDGDILCCQPRTKRQCIRCPCACRDTASPGTCGDWTAGP